MHMNIRVTADIELNFEVESVLRAHYHCCPLVYRAIALLFLNIFILDLDVEFGEVSAPPFFARRLFAAARCSVESFAALSPILLLLLRRRRRRTFASRKAVRSSDWAAGKFASHISRYWTQCYFGTIILFSQV